MRRVTWQERFWAKVDKSKDCWNWTACAPRHKYDSYGRFKIKGVTYRAHRVSYAIEHGVPLTVAGLVLHHCDNPRCVRPLHLFLGDHSRNMQDSYDRGRRKPTQVGAKNNNAKLTADDVILIRQLIAQGKNNIEIAVHFSVTHGAISLIRRGRSWRIRTPS